MNDDYSGSPADNLPAKNPGGKGTRHRHPAVPEHVREVFLEALRKGHTVGHAAEVAGLRYPRRLYEVRDADAEFAAAWDEAWRRGNDSLVEAARERGVEGWDEPIASAGKIVGTKRVYSDRLLERLLAARMPAFRNQPATTLTVNTGADGLSVKAVQRGVTTDEAIQYMLDKGVLSEDRLRSLGLQRRTEIEAPADAAEVVSESDEPDAKGGAE